MTEEDQRLMNYVRGYVAGAADRTGIPQGHFWRVLAAEAAKNAAKDYH